MQRIAAAPADMIVDVDHHLDARQMRRQRSTVDAALGGVACPLGWRRRFVLGLSARRRLLGFFEAEQQLIFRQRLGPSAEAVTLQFLDDLLQARARSASSIALTVPGSSGTLPVPAR